MKKIVSWNTLGQWIDAGLGQGHFEQYQAFLQITRGRFPRRSNQVVGVVPGYKRRFNFLARAERIVGIVAVWLGVRDAREQYPLWPWAHAHPLVDWPLPALMAGLPQPIPLLDVAREAGIDHGTYPGTDVPYVATTDLLVTTGRDETPALVAIACKPKAAVAPGPENDRTVERLELERRYFKAISVRHVIVDSDDLPTALFANLEVFAPDPALYARLGSFDGAKRAEEALRSRLEDESIRDAVLATSCDLRCSPELIWDTFQLLAWRQDIDIDLGEPIHRSLPLRAGGRARRAALAQAWLGEVAHA